MNSVIQGPLIAIVPAAGVGARMGASMPKQYLTLAGKTLVEHTLGRLLSFAPITHVVVAVGEEDPWWPTLAISQHPRINTVLGGETRAHSVVNALQKALQLGGEKTWALVHDMARPLLRLSDIQRLLDGTAEEGAILAAPVVDTIKQTAGEAQAVPCIDATLNRQQIWRALTPQLFPAQALAQALANPDDAITDEASAMERFGWHPRLVCGHADNIKITLPEDLSLAAFYLAQQKQQADDAL